MPGLCLTARQARRLWNLDADTCDGVLAALVRERFLHRSADGAFLRTGAGGLQPPGARPASTCI